MQSCRYIFVFILVLIMTHYGYAQAPVINSVDKAYGTVNEIITLRGSGFGTDTTKIQVTFGAVSAEVDSLNDSMIRVKVPAGATYGSIAVTRLDKKLTAYSPKNFMLSFDGEGFEITQGVKLDGPYSFPTSSNNLYNLCMCDFNLDGKVDIATSDTGDDEITVLENASPDINSVSFTQREFPIKANTRWVRCGDLNGDGLPDLVYAASNTDTNSERIYIYKNVTDTTQSFEIEFETPSTPLSYTLDGTLAARMDIKDLDGDGRPEIVAVAISSEGGVSVLKNTSSGGTISFNPSLILPFQQFNINTTELSGIDLEDLDGDGKAEIIASEDEDSGLHIFKNSSTPGNISFSSYLPLSASGQMTNMHAGDLDGDGLPEIVIVNGGHVGIFKNNSAPGNLVFAETVRFDQLLTGREGLELADMDGNGKLDIIYATTINRVVVLLNQSTASSLDFNTKRTIVTTENSLSVRAGDLNGDGKPDLAYTETVTDKITIQLNRNCVKPILEPQNGLGVCDVLPYQLTVTEAISITSYEWESSADGNSFAPLAAAADSTTSFTTSNEAYYRVRMSSSHNGFDCIDIISNVVQVKRPDGFVPDKPTIIDQNPEEPICFGDRIILRAQDVNARFFWRGPNNFTSNEQNPVINSATRKNEGWYVVYVQASEQNGNCKSAEDSTYIGVSEPEAISISTDDPTVIFEGGRVNMKVTAVAGSTYIWKKNGQVISGATGTTLTANTPGSYTAIRKNETGCTKESTPMEVAYAQVSIPESNCLNENVEVAVAPASLNGQDIRYRWNFGDGSSKQNGASQSHPFAAAGTYTITLEILKSDNSVSDTHSQQITIIDIPELNIETPGSPNLCPEEQVELVANEGFASYAWDNGESGRSLTITEAGTYTLTAVTDANCTETASVEVIQAENPDAVIDAPSDRISLGETLQFNVKGDVKSYLWSPGSSLSDSTIANPVARPLLTTTYTCVVTNEEGCQTTLSYTLNVDRSLDVNPDQAFSPNGDGRHDNWHVERMELFPDCKLTIFDRLGAKLYEIENYSNDNGWDGTVKGRAVPDGVYFFLINCGEEAGSKTGSITIIR